MTRSILRALALGCAGVTLAGCQMNSATQQAIATGAANPGAITDSQVAGAVAASTPSFKVKVAALYGRIRESSAYACGKAPDLLSTAKILSAFFGTAIPASDEVVIETVVSFSCAALGSPIAFTAGTSKAPKKPEPKAEPKDGDPVSGTILVPGPNGQQIPIVVRGTVVDPDKIK